VHPSCVRGDQLKNRLLIFALLLPLPLLGQVTHVPPLSCQVGGQKVQTQGMNSSTLVQRSFPNCTVTVYLTGTITKANVYSDNILTPLANPFTANTDGSIQFWAANGGYDIVTSGGNAGNTFPSPVTYTDVVIGGGGGGGGGGIPGGTNGQIQYNIGGTSFGGIAGSSWDSSGLNLTQSLNSYNLTSIGGVSSIFFTSQLFQIVENPSSDATKTAGLINESNASLVFTDCFGAVSNTHVYNQLGDVGAFPFFRPTICLDDSAITLSVTPPAGDSSARAATTQFLKSPGPIGSVTPSSGAFTSLNVSSLTGAAGTVICIDGSSNLTTAGCSGGGGGSGTVNAGASGALAYYPSAGTTVSGDSLTSLDGSGNLGVQSLSVNGAGTGIITLVQGTGIANPPSGKASLDVDSVTNNLTCTLHSGASCLTLPGAPGGANGSVQFNNSSALGGSLEIYDGSSKFTGSGVTFQADTLEGGTGYSGATTVANKLAKFTTSNTLVPLLTSDTGIDTAYLIAGGAATTHAYPLAAGIGSCIFDGAATPGHLFGASGSSAGDCTDLGTASFGSVTSGLWVGGTIGALVSGTTYAVSLNQGQVAGGAGGGGNMSTSSANTMGASSTIDASGMTGSDPFKVPVKSGFTAGANGSIGVDSSTGKLHTFLSSADRVVCTTQGEAGCAASGNGPPGQSGNSSVNIVRTTSDVTTTSASLVAITGLNWTLPASTAANYNFTCDLYVTDSATTASGIVFGVQDVTTAPTSARYGINWHTAAGTANSNVTGVSTSTTAVTLNSAFQPSTVNALDDHLFGTIEQPSGSASVFQIMADIAGGNTLTILKDSVCRLSQVSN
jgi:collagen type VII alpha